MQKTYHFRIISAILLTFIIMASFAQAQELEDVIFLKGAYQNVADKNAYACTVFSGNANNPPSSPKDGTHYLMQSSIGWPTPATLGWVNPDAPGLPEEPKNAAESLAYEGYQYLKDVQTLFNSYYQNDDPKNPESIYLGFDWFTNHIMNSGGMGQVTIDGKLYDPDVLFDEEAANKAMQYLFIAFNMNPYLEYPIDDSTLVDLRYLLLDIPYYQSVALMMQGNLALERAFCVRFFEELRASGTVINDELEKLGWSLSMDAFDDLNKEGAWKYFNDASKVWLDLFASPIQRAYLKEFASTRTLDYRNNPAFKDTSRPSGLPSDADWPPTVYEGYKDVAAMLRALSQRARVVHEVAWRLVMKLERNQASELIEDYVQQIALEEGVIMSMFFPSGLPDNHETKYPGVAESFLALRDAVTQLGQLREAAVNERLNPLGFDKDVLFVHSVEPSSTDRPLYTFNWLKNQLLANEVNPIGALGTSFTDDETAKTTRKNFDLKASSYLSEFDRIEDEYDQQLISICGADPGNFSKPNLKDPLNGGGLLTQQKTNIEIALNAIERVKRQMENVQSRIGIEQDRVGQLKIVSDKRIRIIYETGSKVGQLQEEMAAIEAEAKISGGIVSGIGSVLGGFGDFFLKLAMNDDSQSSSSRKSPRFLDGLFSGAASAANGFIQAEMQRKIGQKQAAITRLQAEQQAQFEYLSQEAESINSAAQIKTWFLELRTLEIDMYDAELRCGQEMKRLAQLYNEIENKVMRRDRALDRLTRRSFADPTYRIEVTNAALKAEDSFRISQIWVWFLAKSLEYKWPVGKSELGNVIQEILMARTADKLKSLVDNMRTYDTTKMSLPAAAYYYWSYSLRKDYLGMTFEKTDANGNVKSAVEQFQAYLTELRSNTDNIVKVDNADYLAMPFSTVKFGIQDDDSGSETLQDSEDMTHQASATPIFQTGLWDSKIDWLQVSIEGDRISTDPKKMEVFLWYGGSGFVRTKDNFTDPETGSALDYQVFSNPAYTFSYIPGGRGFGWNVLPYIKQKMTAKLGTANLDIPDFVFKNEAFRERPVAATDWRLLIPVSNTTLENIRDIKVNILYTARTRQQKR